MARGRRYPSAAAHWAGKSSPTKFFPTIAQALEKRLAALADLDSVDLVLTTGGTGIGPRDTTPEATAAVCQKLLPGLGELMREKGSQKNPRAVLSRAVAGVCKNALIVNLPGSPRGAVESLDAVAELLPHAVEVLRGASHG